MTNQARPGQTPREKTARVSPGPQPYTVQLTESAKAVYLELRQRSLNAESKGNPSSNHCKTFRIVDDAIRRLIPSDPLNPKYALHKPLNGFYRIAKGRLRIVWAVHPERTELMYLFISTAPRKDGDAKDPYAILNAMKRAGHLEGVLSDWKRASEALDVPRDATVN